MTYPEIMDDLGAALTELYRNGDGWEEIDGDAILARWRAARGDAGKGGWEWWAGCPGEDYDFGVSPSSREAAIKTGHETVETGETFQIIEARCWNDEVQGDDNCRFAETRNHEVFVSTGASAANA